MKTQSNLCRQTILKQFHLGAWDSTQEGTMSKQVIKEKEKSDTGHQPDPIQGTAPSKFNNANSNDSSV